MYNLTKNSLIVKIEQYTFFMLKKKTNQSQQIVNYHA